MIGPQSYAGLMGQTPSQFDENDQFNPQMEHPIVTLANGSQMANGSVPQMSMNGPNPTAAPNPAAFGLLPNADEAPAADKTNWASMLGGAISGGSKVAAQGAPDLYSGLYGGSLYQSAIRKRPV